MANINRDSDAIVKARWADAKRAADQIERLRATVVAADREIKASHADADRYRAEIVRLVTALRDLVERWATERGYDGAIQRARALLLEHDLRSPTTEAIRSALEEP